MIEIVIWVAIAVGTALVVAEVKGGLHALSRVLVRQAAGLLPAAHQERWREEWLRHLEDCSERPLSSLVYSIRILLASSELRACLASGPTLSPADGFIKRCFDFGLTSVLVALLMPTFLVIAVLVRLDSSGPILSREARAGSSGRVFSRLKFRTMVDDVADTPTPIGRVLRRCSLDELPLLLNVLRGEMSVVGPAVGWREKAIPVTSDRELGDDVRNERHLDMRPGLVPAVLDREGNYKWIGPEYATNWSLWRDLKILALGVRYILFPKRRS